MVFHAECYWFPRTKHSRLRLPFITIFPIGIVRICNLRCLTIVFLSIRILFGKGIFIILLQERWHVFSRI